MSRTVTWVCVGIIAFGAASLSAQAAQGPPARTDPLAQMTRAAATGPALTLADALREAIANNAELLALRAAATAAATRPATAGALPPPMLEAEAWQWPINTLNPTKTQSYMFTIAQELPGKGKRDQQAAVLTADARMSANDVDARAQQIRAAVTRAYVELAVARQAAPIYAEASQLLRQMADAAELRYAAGRGPQQDALKAFVELSRLYDDAIDVDAQARLVTARLDALMGRSPASPIGALDDLGGPVTLPDPAVLVEKALGAHPEIAGAKLAIARAEAEAAEVKSDTKSDYTVRGGYMLMPQGGDAWLASIAMTWPGAPWSHGRTDARSAAATAGISAAKAQLVAAERTRALAVQEAWVRANTAAARVSLIDTSVLPQVAQSLASARIAYESGRAEFAALLDAGRVLLDERLRRLRAQGEFLLARADLDLAVGGL